jgi:asparagine synthase (glutamine-hydrolysing)
MCRIAGYLGRDRTAEERAAASRAQLAGGPDEQAWVTGPGWGLGSNRLAIQDPSSGKQPITSDDGRVTLVFNGEVYNFREIAERLAAQGVSIAGDCDTSVLLPAYLVWGDRFVAELEGMYAIAVMDLRDGPLLKLWTDPLAVKSVYYSNSTQGFAFASELAALSAIRGVAPELEPLAVDGYFDFQCMPRGETHLRGVRSLEPGSLLVYDGSRVTVKEAAEPGHFLPSDRRPEELAGLLEHEIDHMSRQGTAIAVQVSGGLDSAVLLTMLRQRRRDVKAFHVSFQQSAGGSHPLDERRFAEAAAAHARVELDTVEIAWDQLPDLLPRVVTALGSPNATPHAVSAHVLFEEISRQGFRVCFVGDGADEQFGGYRRYSRALRDRSPDWDENYLDGLSLVPEKEYQSLYTDDFRALLVDSGSSRQRTLERFRRPAASRLEQMLSFDRADKLPHLNLRKLDHLSMAHSVEGRVPFCQPSITSFARGLPDVRKVDGDDRKPILWSAGERYLPRTISERSKQPFSLPVGVALRPGSRVWEYLVDVVSGSRLCAAGILDAEAVSGVVASHLTGSDRSRLLWGILVLELSVAPYV